MAGAHASMSWLIGRGCSVAAGLTWTVPTDWRIRPRDEQIELMVPTLREASQARTIDLAAHLGLIEQLHTRNLDGIAHTLITTNWDLLLERSLQSVFPGEHPRWLDTTYVAHINGSIEIGLDPAAASPFLLETDGADQRRPSVEANNAFNRLMWSQVVAVIGMSFECTQDRFLLRALAEVEDDLPVGSAVWAIVNPATADCSHTCELVASHLPRARVIPVQRTFEEWVGAGLPEMVKARILRP